MDILLQFDRLIEICKQLDSSGIIERFVHVPYKDELYDFNPYINISNDMPDINMYYIRFGYDLKIDQIHYNMNMYPISVLVTNDYVELNIMFTPNHFDEFHHKLKKQLKKITKKYNIHEYIDDIPEKIYYSYNTLMEYQFHSKLIRNYFWNNLLLFYYDKDKIIQKLP